MAFDEVDHFLDGPVGVPLVEERGVRGVEATFGDASISVEDALRLASAFMGAFDLRTGVDRMEGFEGSRFPEQIQWVGI
jgi:hypothetical protein